MRMRFAATPDSGWISCCSAPISCRACRPRKWTWSIAAGRSPAITHPYGSTSQAHSAPRAAARRRGPGWQHRGEYPVTAHEVVIEPRKRMQSGDPQDRVAEPGMERGDARAEVVRFRDPRGDLHTAQQRERVAFEPRAGDR